MLKIKEYPTLHMELIKNNNIIKLQDTRELIQVRDSIEINLNERKTNEYKITLLYEIFDSLSSKDKKNIIDILQHKI